MDINILKIPEGMKKKSIQHSSQYTLLILGQLEIEKDK